MEKQKFNESDLYIIRAVTNIHVGSGDNNFGIIDNQVQRDILTNRPTINSSSLKGSLREYFSKLESKQLVEYIFGSPPKEEDSTDKEQKQEKGKFTFISANLLVLPLRANTKTFFRVTSPEIIQEFLDYLDTFDIDLKQKELLQELANLKPKDEVYIFEDIKDETIIEDTKALYIKKDLSSLGGILGRDIAIMDDNLFKEYIQNLPVIARNHLENGESQNLWYEEIVPRESRFYFIVTKPTNIDIKDYKQGKIKKFEARFEENRLIQIGANATIGYGYTKIDKIQKEVSKNEKD